MQSTELSANKYEIIIIIKIITNICEHFCARNEFNEEVIKSTNCKFILVQPAKICYLFCIFIRNKKKIVENLEQFLWAI